MSEPTRPVFVSYAKEDAAVARRIADALTAFGVDVWLDQSELGGGDAWDTKIRRQISECALFLPIVSAQTQVRREGYFRREWSLGVERSQDFAYNAPFLVPIAIDQTSEKEAVVPEAFMKVQWLRIQGGEPTPELVTKIKKLLNPMVSVAATTRGAVANAAATKRGFGWVSAVALAVIVAGLGGYGWETRNVNQKSGEKGLVATARPVVLLMDTPYSTHVYDPTTLKAGGTNADDITDVLRDLPITIVKENTGALWHREAEVISLHPSLIVMHRSCFFSFPDAQAPDLYPVIDVRLVAFLGYVSSQLPGTKFIVYSRYSWEDASVAAAWRQQAGERFPSLAGKVETWRVPLDRATFRNPITAQELKDSVVRALQIDTTPSEISH